MCREGGAKSSNGFLKQDLCAPQKLWAIITFAKYQIICMQIAAYQNKSNNKIILKGANHTCFYLKRDVIY